MKRQSGFTLIELLVVIAIIGILASVVLGSLRDARDGGLIAKIQTEMDAVSKRAAAEQLNTGSYDTVCGSNGATQATEIANLIASINSVASSTVVCNSDVTEFAVSAPVGTVHWCVDSLRTSKEIPSELGPAELVCP